MGQIQQQMAFDNPSRMGAGGGPKGSSKEQFQSYLEQTGVIDALTKVLVRCYEEPVLPDSPPDFIKSYLGVPTGSDDAASKQKIKDNNAEIDRLTQKRADLQAKLASR